MVPADRATIGSLGLRTLSALVLAPVAIAVAWFGSPYLPILTTIAGAVMAWEWARLCCGGRLGTSGIVLIGAVVGAVAAAAAAGIALAIGVSLAGAAITFGLAQREPDGAPRWLAIGTLWIALPCVLLLWLARPDRIGPNTVLWIFAVVWSTDIGAYAIGRRIGG
ncbi:MAG: phosphatidate cytidylyltransferase, partial [Alphaproteobacteria bacterium]